MNPDPASRDSEIVKEDVPAAGLLVLPYTWRETPSSQAAATGNQGKAFMIRTSASHVWFFVAATCLTFTTAHADIYDTFLTKWRSWSFGSGVTSEMVRNRLEVSLASDASGGLEEFGSGLIAKCAVGGNFDLRVPFRLLDWPDQNGSRVAVQVWDDAPFLGSIFIERASFPEGDDPQDPGDVYRFIGFDNDNTHDTSDQYGVLRLRRVGSVVTGYYGSNGNWVELGNAAIGSQDLRFALVVFSNDGVFTHMDVRAAFNSVRVATGTLTGAGCPSSMSTTTNADTIYDTFLTKWRPVSVGSGTTSEMVRNRLEVSLDADATNESGNVFGGGLYGTCAVSGDFDLRTSFRLLDWPGPPGPLDGNGARVALTVGTLSQVMNAGGISIARANDPSSFPYPHEAYVFGGAGGNPAHATADESGALRLQRTGSVVTGYYGLGGNWVELGSTAVGTQDLRFSLIVYGFDSTWMHEDVRAAFDSVSIIKGTLTGAACPIPTS